MMRILMEEYLDERGSTFLHTRPTCISTYSWTTQSVMYMSIC